MAVCLDAGSVNVMAQESEALESADSQTSESSDRESSADFVRDVAPILSKNCVACHNARKAEGGLNLESHSALMQGGDSDAAVEPGNPEDSYLLQRILDDDDPMPPDDNSVGAKRLSQAEISVVSAWIHSGALAGMEAAPQLLKWQPLPESIQPVNALAASPDGNTIAMGRGNQAIVLRSSNSAAANGAFTLNDPTVSEVLGQSVPSAAQLNASHLDIVQSVAFSPDSQLIATGGYRSVKIWQRKTTPVDTLNGAVQFSEPPTAVATNAAGTHIAIASGNQLEIIDLQTSVSQRFLRAHPSPIAALAWSDDEKTVISVGVQGEIVLTDVGTMQQNSPGISLPSEGRRILNMGSDRFIVLDASGNVHQLEWNAESSLFKTHQLEGVGSVAAIAIVAEFSATELPAEAGSEVPPSARPPATAIAFCHQDGIFQLVDSDSLEVIKEFPIGAPAREIAVSRNGRWLAAVRDEAPAELWRIDSGESVGILEKDYHLSQQVAQAERRSTRQQGLVNRITKRLEELSKAAEAEEAARTKLQEGRDTAAEELAKKEAEVVTVEQAVSGAESALAESEAALAEAMKLVEQRKTELEAKKKEVSEAIARKDQASEELVKREQALATAEDATKRARAKIPETEVIIAQENERLGEYQNYFQSLLEQTKVRPAATKVIFADNSGTSPAAAESEFDRVVVADQAGQLHFYSAHDASPEAILTLGSPAVAIAAVGNDRQLISLNEQGVLQRWDLHLTWELKRTIGNFEDSPFSDRITALDFSPDGSRLAVGGGPPSRFGEIHLIDVESGAVASALGEVHSDTVLSVKFSPDGRHLASGAADKIVRIFEVADGRQVGSLEGHTHHVLSLSWNDDCVTLATASADMSVKVWDVESATQKRTVGGFKKEVTAVGFVGQTNQLLAIDAAGIAQLIDTESGKQIRSFAGADSPLISIGISPKGDKFFAGGQSGRHWGWQLEDGKLLP
jgi:WD40 repeat protein